MDSSARSYVLVLGVSSTGGRQRKNVSLFTVLCVLCLLTTVPADAQETPRDGFTALTLRKADGKGLDLAYLNTGCAR